MTPTRRQRKRRVPPRRRNRACAEHELDRRLALLLLPAMPAPHLRRRILEAIKRED
jgi:hypothetical protein